jgi:putative transposase
MKKKFTEAQILTILKEGETGISVTDICRKHSIVNSTYYTWKDKYSGMTISDLVEFKRLKEENSRLKKMYADVCLEHKILKEIVEKKL